jgi:hypothetical protein
VIATAWSSHTAVRGRLEVTASELHQLAGLLRDAPAAAAVASLIAKVNATASRMELGTLIETEPDPGQEDEHNAVASG